MSASSEESLLERLAGLGQADPWQAVAASEPQVEPSQTDAHIERVRQLLKSSGLSRAEPSGAGTGAETAAEQDPDDTNTFVPEEPASLEAAGLTPGDVEALVLKMLFGRGDASGRDIAEQIKLPFVLVDDLLRRLKTERLVGHRSSAAMNDFVYELSELGRERARRFAQHCTYFGAAPVPLRDYIEGVAAQSLTRQHPSVEALRRAFDDLVLSPQILDRLGPAINSGRGLFLYGAPGNGKTSIAERVTKAFGQHIWIPRAIGIDGEIIRLYDPVNHIEAPLVFNRQGLWHNTKIDRRWIRIRRPTIIAAGELTLESLEVTFNPGTGIGEAPLQLKSNCGTLVIDDFGRQRVRIEELLNRWIVPLERHHDYLNLSHGKKIQVPFDQLLIFSTNLEPSRLVDEAFMRRIPYKIAIVDPTEDEFRGLVRSTAEGLGFACLSAAIDYLIDRHYKGVGRPFRFCQPRDLLMQIRNYCAYHDRPLVLQPEYFDFACENYFGIIDEARRCEA